MEKVLKKIVLPVIIIILSLNTVLATPYLQDIQGGFNSLTIMIKEEEQQINCLLYGGTNYVSIRDLAKVLGYEVIWDGVNKSIQLINKKENVLEGYIRAYNRSFYDTFFTSRDWEKGYEEYQSGLEPYGERGTISWPISSYLESEVLMYKATKDPIYLNRVIDVMDKILNLRDSVAGRVNKYGESPPIWCAGSRYGWGKSILENKNGEEVVEVIAYGTWEVDTGVVGELRKRNDSTYITVLKGSTKDTFKLRIKNEIVDFDRTYDELTLKKEGIILDDNSVCITVLKSSDELPVFQEEKHIGNILTPNPLHTGLLLTPIIQLTETIKAENLNEYYQKKASKYLEAVIEAVEYHEADWVDLDIQSGYYSGLARADTKNKRPLPWNQMFELGRTLSGLYNVTEKEEYKEKVEKMISYFKHYVEYDNKNDLYIWKYWNWDGYTVTEGINYSIIDMTFIYEAYRAGIGFSEEDMNRFVNTYRKNVYCDDDSIARRIDGKGKYNRKNWLSLARVNFLSEWGDNYFFYKPLQWIEESENTGIGDFGKLVAIARSVYQKRIIDPNFVDITNEQKIGNYRSVE